MGVAAAAVQQASVWDQLKVGITGIAETAVSAYKEYAGIQALKTQGQMDTLAAQSKLLSAKTEQALAQAKLNSANSLKNTTASEYVQQNLGKIGFGVFVLLTGAYVMRDRKAN